MVIAELTDIQMCEIFRDAWLENLSRNEIMLSKTKVVSTTIFILTVGYLFLVYTKFTLNPLDMIDYQPQTAIDWENASRLELTAPQVFLEMPGRYLTGFKNPCWQHESDGRLLCLPYFYLAGMPKCGTTDLWSKLIQHPLIAKPGKEPHWWTRKRRGYYAKDNGGLMPPNEYYERMSRSLKRAAKNSGIGKNRLIIGDGSASTLWDNRRWSQIYPHHKEGPPHIIAEVIATIQPNAKVIVILRDPTERLYSDYLFVTNTTIMTPEDFHKRVVTSLRRWFQCNSHHERRSCTYKSTWGHEDAVRINVGIYSIFIADWLRLFPKSQMLVLRIEDWHDDCVNVLRSVHKFLDIYPLTGGQMYHICGQDQENTRPDSKKNIGPMLNQTRKILDQFYDPFNEELANLLNDDRFLWS